MVSFSASDSACWRVWIKKLRMFGLMPMETESFKESKQASGYGVVLQKLFMEERLESREAEEDEEELRANVEEKKIERRRRERVLEEAMRVDAEALGAPLFYATEEVCKCGFFFFFLTDSTGLNFFV